MENHRLKSANILVVDQEPIIGTVIEEALKAGGHSVKFVHTEEEALAAIRKASGVDHEQSQVAQYKPFDVVFIDIGQSSLVCAEVIKAARSDANPAIILISSEQSKAVEINKPRLGADEIVYKPLNPFDVRGIVGRCLDRSHSIEVPGSPHILILDDDDIVLSSVTDVLSDSYDVTGTTSPKEALRLLNDKSYEIVLVDLMMDEMHGIDFIQAAKIIRPSIMAIVITGYANKDAAVNALRCGAYDFLEKPLTPNIVLQTVARGWKALRTALENRRLLAELRQINEKLEGARNYTNSIIHSMIYAMVVVSQESVIQTVNQAVCDLLGYSEDELIGQPVSKILEIDAGFDATMKKERIYGVEKTYISREGQKIPMLFSSSIVQGRDGGIQGILYIAKDIREEKKMQEHLVRSEKLASLGTFISGVAHELNNPLTIILGFSAMLMENAILPPEVHDDLLTISDNSKRCSNIVKNLLRFSRKYEQGKTPININEEITATLELQAYLFREDDILVEKHFESGPDLFVMGDINGIQQVFMNIILNAHNAMATSTKKKIFNIFTRQNDSRVLITFENNGPLIPNEIINKIFDPFFTTHEVGKGTGLGLSISYSIIKEHGGKIWAENIHNVAPGFAPGTGVRFFIELPIYQCATNVEHAEVLEEKLPKGINVLLVDDEEPLLIYLSRVLTREGCQVLTAKNGLEAVQHLQDRDFDLIFSDIKMPDMDGYELGNWISKNKPKLMSGFVVLTGVIDMEVENFCSRYNCDSLIKPCENEEIFKIIWKVIK